MISRRWWDVSCEENYVGATLETYLSLPQTPDSVQCEDRSFASDLYRQGYELYNVEAALLVGSVRRIFSKPHSYQSSMTLKEFASYIEELRDERIELEYVRYLRHLLSPVLHLEAPKGSR